jgi:Na+-translocating ferredoxin:NAD+ oxidoreductase RnfE subunit
MAEKHSAHAMWMEKFGLACGFVLALLVLGGGIWLLGKGRRIEGLAALVGTAGAYFWFQKRQVKPQSGKSG